MKINNKRRVHEKSMENNITNMGRKTQNLEIERRYKQQRRIKKRSGNVHDTKNRRKSRGQRDNRDRAHNLQH